MRGTRIVWILALAAAMFAALSQSPASAQEPGTAGRIRLLPLRGNLFMLSGGGANIVASVGKDGVLLVDSGTAEMSAQVLQAITELSRRVTSSAMPQQSCVGLVRCEWWDSSRILGTIASPPPQRRIIGIINTSFDADHMGGNAVIVNSRKNDAARAFENIWIVAHENALKRASQPPAAPSAAWPTEAYFGADKKLNFVNGEGVVIWYRPSAHTDADSVVQFRGSEVLAVGDILNMTSYPVIDIAKGGSVQGVIDSLNWILDAAVVEHMMEGGTLIVPGHGRVTDSADVAYYRDMVTIVRDRVREMMRRGMTLSQIQAARLTKDYDPRFGRNASWTPEMFVESVYRSLGGKVEE